MKTYFWKKYRINKEGTDLAILNKRTPYWKAFILLLPSLLTISLFTLIPFIIVLYNSFQVQSPTSHLVADTVFSIDNYKSILTNPFFKVGVRNSIIYSIVALPISLFISVLISVAITMVVKKWARGFWQTVFFLPYVTSAVAVSLSFLYMFKSDGGIINGILLKLGRKKPIQFLNSGLEDTWNAFWVILLRGIWGNLAFQILILTTAMLSVDKQLYKAGAIDGASKSKQFFAITLPSIKRTLSFLITMGLINGIKVFPLALFNNNPEDAINNGGSSIMLFVYRAVKAGKWYYSGAASVILFVIGVFVSFTLRKIVTLTFKLSVKLGENNVIRKIENSTLKTKTIFTV